MLMERTDEEGPCEKASIGKGKDCPRGFGSENEVRSIFLTVQGPRLELSRVDLSFPILALEETDQCKRQWFDVGSWS